MNRLFRSSKSRYGNSFLLKAICAHFIGKFSIQLPYFFQFRINDAARLRRFSREIIYRKNIESVQRIWIFSKKYDIKYNLCIDCPIALIKTREDEPEWKK